MNTFYIARHGETENNRAKRLSGWIDTPLTVAGLLPTIQVIEKMKNLDLTFETIYSSDLGRAFITAYAIARGIEHDDEIKMLSGLREVNYGDAANMFSKDAYGKYPRLDRDTHYMPPNGETLKHMQQRVFDTVNKINDAHSNANILLVCHSGTMAAICASHIGQDFGEHNISEAYPHDALGTFTMHNNEVAMFKLV